VHPAIIELYENNHLHSYFEQIDKIGKEQKDSRLANEEKLLMTILEKEGLVCV
jgi:hypothetical protein